MRHEEILNIIDNAYEDARLLAERRLGFESSSMLHICCQTLLLYGMRKEIELEEIAIRINSLCIDYIWSYLDVPEKQTLLSIRAEIKAILGILNSL